MLGGLTMWIDPKSVPARVSMGTHKSSGNSNVSFRNHDCTYHFHNYHGAKVIAASRLVLDGAWYLFVDLLFLRFLRRFRVLRSELSYGAQRSSQVNKNTVQAILAPLQILNIVSFLGTSSWNPASRMAPSPLTALQSANRLQEGLPGSLLIYIRCGVWLRALWSCRRERRSPRRRVPEPRFKSKASSGWHKPRSVERALMNNERTRNH